MSVTGPGDVIEGAVATFTVSLSGASDRVINVAYRTEDGTAVGSGASPDYVPQSASATFAAGTTLQSIDVTTIDDADREPSETFELVLTDAGPWATLASDRALVTIVDNDLSVSLAPQQARADEGETMQFTVEIGEPVSETLRVEYYTQLVTTGLAASATDFAHVPATSPRRAVIAAGDTTATIRIATYQDLVSEGDEQFLLQLASPQPDPTLVVGDGTAVGTIVDDEGDVTVRVRGARSAAEGDPLEFVLTADASRWPLDLNYSLSGTATQHDDYQSIGPIEFRPHQTELTVRVTTVDDSEVEEDETVTLTLTSGSLRGQVPSDIAVIVDPAAASATAVIFDNDTCTPLSQPGTATMDDLEVFENAGAATLSVAMSAPFCEDVTVEVSTVDASAVAGEDFGAASNVSVDAVDSNGDPVNAFDVTVPLVDDDVSEPDEEFFVRLYYDEELWASATVTIIDDDQPKVSIADAEAAEGETMTFVVTLEGELRDTVEVRYQTHELSETGSADRDSDYSHSTGRLTINPGATSGEITVETRTDDLDEGVEEFQLRLSEPVNAVIVDGTATGFIKDRNCVDPLDAEASLITLSVPAEITIREDVGGVDGIVPVNFSAKPCTGSVAYTVTTVENGTAKASTGPDFAPGDDFRPMNSTGTFAADATDYVHLVYPPSGIHDDDVFENAAETFRVTVQWDDATMPAQYHGVAPVHADITIIDDDANLTITDAGGWEGHAVKFTAQLNEPSEDDVIIYYQTERDSTGANPAGPFTDFEPVVSGSVTIAAGNTVAYIWIYTEPDGDHTEGDETFLLEYDAFNATAASEPAVGTIWDVTPDNECSVDSRGYPGQEFRLTGIPSSGPMMIHEHDTGRKNWYWSIGQGNCSGDGFFQVETQLRFAWTYQNGSGRRALWRFDRDPTIADASEGQDLWYGAPGGTTTLALTNGVSDYFDRLWIVNDDDFEGDETLVYRVRATSNFGAGRRLFTIDYPVTIIDDDDDDESDPIPRVSVTDATATEGGTIEFTIAIDVISPYPIVVPFETRTHTSAGPAAATAGRDYVHTVDRVTIPAGSTSATAEVVTLDDASSENSESFLLVLGQPSGAELAVGGGEAVGTIFDDDVCLTPTNPIDAPAAIVLSASAVPEDAGTLTVTVTHSNVCGVRDDALRYGTTATSDTSSPPLGETATPGRDYATIAEGTIDLDGSTTTSTFAINISEDDIYELDETFTVWVEWGPGMPATYEGWNRTTLTVRILNNDPQPTLSIADASATYGRPLQFVVTLDGPTEVAVTVGIRDSTSYSPPTGERAARYRHYLPIDTHLTFSAPDVAGGPATQTVTVQTVTEYPFDSTETYDVTRIMQVLLDVRSHATIANGRALGTISPE